MPTITIQVGQCGNQLGSCLWRLFDSQAAACDAKASLACDWEYFREGMDGKRLARCLLVDTEPKVVNNLVGKASGRKLFSAARCFIGQSGRGNNWAFGYSQLLPSRSATGLVPGKDWDWRTNTEEPDAQEARMLQDVMEGVRQEAESCDTAPSFMLLHSLGGGSGSGLGSRILESVREEYALNYIATVSVAPRTAGDSPMQSLNSVMALSFLQAYADVVMLHNNTELLNRACKGGRSAGMSDVNQLIAESALGALWPLDADEVAGANARIADMVCTVAADPCLKVVETHTALTTSSLGMASWQDASKTLNRHHARYDALDRDIPVVISSGGRSGPSTAPAAIHHYIHAVGGASRFSCPSDAHSSVLCRHSPTPLHVMHGGKEGGGRQGSGRPLSGGAAGFDAGAGQGGVQIGAGMCPALTSVTLTSGVVGFLSEVARKAGTMCAAGAYMHWYERYGSSQAAVQEAVHTVQDMADSYMHCHGVRDVL